MKNRQIPALLGGLLASIALGLTACGGGSGSSDNSDSSSNGQTVSGQITAFGSIYVNGVEHETGNATIYVEDEPSSEDNLKVGMVVHIEKDGSGKTIAVHYDDDLEGVVISSDILGDLTGSMNIMGQTVTVTADTLFESHVTGITSVAHVVAGNIVEVSGYSSASGDITATRIEVKAADVAAYLDSGGKLELKGTITGHDTTAKTFNIGDLTIIYDDNTVLDDMSGGITDNVFVEVKSTQGLNADGQLIASKVERENHGYAHHQGDEDEEYELHGIVRAVEDNTITVNSQTVQLTDHTEYEHGDKADIAVGVELEVEGRFDAEGILIAKEVKFESHDNDYEMKDVIAEIVVDDTNIGTITLANSAVIKVNNDTVMCDSRDHSSVMHFNLKSLAVDDYIEVKVVDNGDGTYTATKVERENKT